ncbi:nuclear protein DGCR14 [Delphinella strobiligena]|nr:nuclear protein DGCR14 [Delphinella strobiligena]
MADSKSSSALAKRNADNALMPPPPAPKRIKRPTKVLDEDVYTDTLSHIIARDFFPGLLETQAQEDYLEALDSKNNDWIREAGRKLHQAMTPGPGGRGRRGTSMAATSRQTSATPRGWGGETPRRTAPSETPNSTAGDDDRPKQAEVDASLSLGAFQAKYTSEDNESFNALLDRQNVRRAENYAFLYHGNKIPAGRLLEYRKNEQKKLLQSASDSTAITLRPSQNLDDRKATIDTFTSRQGPRNTLMFAPDGIEDTHTTIAQAAADRSLVPPKAVSYAATRLPPLSTEAIPPPSPSISAIDAAIAGRPRPSSTEAGYPGAETPRVAGYAFVDAEPTPAELAARDNIGTPVSDEEASRQEQAAAMSLMPKLDDASAPKNPFTLQSSSKREQLHHRIVDKQNSQRRKVGGQQSDRISALKSMHTPGRTPTPAFKSAASLQGRKVLGGGLTPAARMLAASMGRTPGRTEGRKGREKSRAWTPTPRVKRG